MQLIWCLLIAHFGFWSYSTLADNPMTEQALTNSSHFYLESNFVSTKFYHKDSQFSIRGRFEPYAADMYSPPVAKIAFNGKVANEVFEFWVSGTAFASSANAEGGDYRTITFNMPSGFPTGNIMHWPANATLLEMSYTNIYGVARPIIVHQASHPFGEVYYRPTLNTIMPYLHQTWTRDWLLNGTGLEGVKALTLMAKDNSYGGTFDITTIADIVSTFPLASNHLHLRLKPGNRWGSFDGAKITVATLDTGAGPVVPSENMVFDYNQNQYIAQSASIAVWSDPPASIRFRIMKERLSPMSRSQPRLMYASITTEEGTSTSAKTLTIYGNALQPPPTTSTAPSVGYPSTLDGYYQTVFNQQQQWSMDFYHVQRLVLACTGTGTGTAAPGSSSDAIVYQLQEGVDYITDREQSTVNKRVLRLLPGASWCPPSLYVSSVPTNVENATPRFTTRNEPQLLRLLAVESPYRGYFISVNPANFVAGAAMAMVVWPPTIYPKRMSNIPRLAIIRRPLGNSSPSIKMDTTRIHQDRRSFWISGRYFPVNVKANPAPTPSDSPRHQPSSLIASNVPSIVGSIFSPHVNASWTPLPPPTTTFRVRFNRPLMPERDYTLDVVSSSRVRIIFTPRFLETSYYQHDVWIGPLYVTHVKVGLAAKTDDEGGVFVDGEQRDVPLFAETVVDEEERTQRRERLCGGVVPVDEEGHGRLEDNDHEDAYEACLAYMEEVKRGVAGDRELDGDDGWITLANGGVYVAELTYTTEGDA